MTTAQYNTCVDQFADGLYRFMLKQVRDKDVARDLVQDTFEKVWVKVEEVPFEKAKSYLFTTAYRTFIDHNRRQSKFDSYDAHPVEQPVYTPGGHSDLKEVLSRALQRLPEIQRTVVLLRDYEGYAYQEIGEITGLNESQVKVYLYRARVALKEFIGKPENVI